MLSVFFKTACIFLISSAGFVLRRRGVIDTPFNRQLSLLQINVIYPALILSSLTRNFTWTTLLANWMLPAGSALIMVVGWTVGLLCIPLLRRQAKQTAAMFQFLCTINNYSFLPIMLAATMLNEMGVAQIILSAIGAELVLWTLGVQALARGQTGTEGGGFPDAPRLGDPAPAHQAGLAERAVSAACVLRGRLKNLCSMPLLAMACGACWLLLRHHAGGAIDALQATEAGGGFGSMISLALHMTGQATIPLSAIIVGSRIGEIRGGQIFSKLIVLLTVLRLAVIPAIATALIFWLPFPAAIRPALLIVAAQPCSMASVMLGEAYQCDARLAAAAVLVTHALCLITIPLWLSAPWWPL